jgi:hypothetical protein
MNDETVVGVHWRFWAIGAVTLIYNIAGVINFFTQMNADAVAAMPGLYRAIIEGRPAWATGAFAVAVFGGALGCLLLLLRKSAAYYVFIASLLGAIVTMIHTLGMGDSDFGPVGAVIGNLVQLVVTAFLIWHSKQAESKGWIS